MGGVGRRTQSTDAVGVVIKRRRRDVCMRACVRVYVSPDVRCCACSRASDGYRDNRVSKTECNNNAFDSAGRVSSSVTRHDRRRIFFFLNDDEEQRFLGRSTSEQYYTVDVCKCVYARTTKNNYTAATVGDVYNSVSV